jgi:hypothetical protein
MTMRRRLRPDPFLGKPDPIAAARNGRRCATYSSEDEFVYILEGEPGLVTNLG